MDEYGRIIIDNENSRLVLENNDSTFCIRFSSMHSNEFFISKENDYIYDIFKLSLENDSILESIDNDEYMHITIKSDGILLIFPSKEANISISKDNDKLYTFYEKLSYESGEVYEHKIDEYKSSEDLKLTLKVVK